MEYLTFSAPGRVELGGNHTDHQHGCVLAAAIDRTARARVRPTGEGVVRVFSRGYAAGHPLAGLRRMGGVRRAAGLRPLQQRRL